MPTLYNSRGSQQPERNDPYILTANAGLSFVGSYVLGMGFTLTPDQRDELIKRNRKNGDLIHLYLGGKEVNTSPTQAFHRYVINFGNMSLEGAERWPDLLSIVREKVKPERDRLPPKNSWNRDVLARWWQFGAFRVGLSAAIRDLPRCLVNSQVTKHLMFSFQPVDRVLADSLYAYPLPHHTHFAILQSRIHESWARLLSSSMKTDLRYVVSDCFNTFPFPKENPRGVIPELESIGQRLYDARAAYMVDTNQGLTKTYNALKDPKVNEPRICELRNLHEEMDRQVLAAYGWEDITVPPFVSPTPDSFKDEIIDRLFELNKKRSTQQK